MVVNQSGFENYGVRPPEIAFCHNREGRRVKTNTVSNKAVRRTMSLSATLFDPAPFIFVVVSNFDHT
jgi:hypothetical protein